MWRDCKKPRFQQMKAGLYSTDISENRLRLRLTFLFLALEEDCSDDYGTFERIDKVHIHPDEG